MGLNKYREESSSQAVCVHEEDTTVCSQSTHAFRAILLHKQSDVRLCSNLAMTRNHQSCKGLLRLYRHIGIRLF